MKMILFTLALAGLATSSLQAQQPSRNRIAPLPGAHESEGVLIVYGATNFTGQSQRVSGAQASFTAPFTIRSLSIRPGDRWQICTNANFRPPCTSVTRPISDASILGITGQVGSIRLLPEPSATGN